MIGFGEAARAFSSGWPPSAERSVTAYDVKLDDPHAAADMLRAMSAGGIRACASTREALAGADAVFCLVTADQAEAAAAAGAPHLAPGAVWFDGNSCSPQSKRRAADHVGQGGGRYVDVAIMAPVAPRRHRTPILVSGADAEEAAGVLRTLDMNAEIAGSGIGDASTTKMLRSVMIKGIEALMVECLLAARTAGVEDQVLASLQASDPGFDWRERAAYNFERMMVHGRRRAAEMREVAATVEALGFPNPMSSATAEWEGRIGALDLPGGPDDLAARIDSVLLALGRQPPSDGRAVASTINSASPAIESAPGNRRSP